MRYTNSVTTKIYGVTGGSTDAAAVQLVRQGLGVLPICLPCRYTHSLVETVSLRDLDFAAALVQEMLIHFPENDLRKGDGKKSLL